MADQFCGHQILAQNKLYRYEYELEEEAIEFVQRRKIAVTHSSRD